MFILAKDIRRFLLIRGYICKVGTNIFHVVAVLIVYRAANKKT